ncbi:hypothetical protein [Arsukibacterium ikkense]|uniref:hypothetical protein n=1 Tax=Arsukibacterium ikkense TaxID=336831 RepID=UPI00069C43E9|nr:hypothetical protein [Arsukibacterium ikkense]
MRVPNSHRYASHQAEKIKRIQRQNEIAHVLEQHNTTLLVMNSAEFVELALNIKQQSGMTELQSRQWLIALLNLTDASKNAWQVNDTKIKFISGFTSAGLDAAAMAIIARDLQRGGNVFAKFQVQQFQGQQHIVFEGYAGLRQHLTGTRYLAANPKIVSMGIGKLGALKAIKIGFAVTIVVSVAFHGLDQLMNDQRTWHHFVGGVAADAIYSCAVAVGSWSLVASVVGGASMMAIGPILAVVLVGVALGLIVYLFDSHFELSEKLAALLVEFEAQLNADVASLKQLKVDYQRDRQGFLKRLFAIPDIRPFHDN